MKRINKRSVVGVYKFTCETCGSVFEADEQEYKVSKDTWDEYEDFGFLKSRTMAIRTPIFRLISECPICQNVTMVEFETGEPKYKTEVFFTTF